MMGTKNLRTATKELVDGAPCGLSSTEVRIKEVAFHAELDHRFSGATIKLRGQAR